MTQFIEGITWFGEVGLWWYGVPLLAWSVLAALVLAGLRLAEAWHPFFHLSVRQALLFTLPLGLLAAVAVGRVVPGVADGPVAEVRATARVAFAAPQTSSVNTPAPQAKLPAVPSGGEAVPETSAPAMPGAYFWIGLATIAAGVLGLKRFGRLLREAGALRRLREALPPVSSEMKSEIIMPLEEKLGLAGRSVTYRTAPPEAMPATFGSVRPVVALPKSLLDREDDLRLALVHELVHVRRRDAFFRWVERMVDAFFAASPVVRYLLKDISRYREQVCDAEVVRLAEAPAAYAAMLSRQLFPRSSAQECMPASMSMARSPCTIKTRIAAMERLTRTNQSTAVPRRASFTASALVMGLVSTVVFLAACSKQMPATPQEASTQAKPFSKSKEASGSVFTADSVFAARLKKARSAVQAASNPDSLRRVYAEDFFQHYLQRPETKTGQKAVHVAFLWWESADAVDEMDEAMARLEMDGRAWSMALRSVGSAYRESSERTSADYTDLLEDLKGRLTHPRSKSAALLELARHYQSSDENRKTETEKLFRDVVDLNADSIMVDIALGNLHEMEALNIGQEAPGFEAQTISGERMALSELEGKVVLLEFWATWCGPCRPEIPHLKQVQKEYGGEEFQLVGISLDESTEKLRQFVRARSMSWPQVREAEGFDTGIAKQYSVLGIPRSYLIDRSGRIAAKDMRGEEYAEEISQLMEKGGE